MVLIPRDRWLELVGKVSESSSKRMYFSVDDIDSTKELEDIEQSKKERMFEFDFGEYEQIQNNSDRIRYVKDSCEFVGNGSSRITFIMNDGRALKIAKNPSGIAQNRDEYQNVKGNRYFCFPMIYDITETRDSMLVECGTVAYDEDFESYYGMSVDRLVECLKFFRWMMLNSLNYRKWESVKIHLRKYMYGDYDTDNIPRNRLYATKGYADEMESDLENLFNNVKGYNAKVLMSLLKFIEDNMESKVGKQVILEDLENPLNWALVERDGKRCLVVCDIGFTNDVREEFY